MICLIPARIGSKGVPLKNLRDLGGYPLLAWSIAAGRVLGYQVIVSTDSNDIGRLEYKYFFDVHYRKEVGDNQADIEVVTDVIKKYRDNEIIYLRPTTPLRNPVLLKEAVATWGNCKADSLCSGHILPESADKYFKWDKWWRYQPNEGIYQQVVPYNDNIKLNELHKPNQQCTQTIKGNGVIDIFRTDNVKDGILWGEDMLGFITPPTVEIDTEEDLEYCQWLVDKKGHPLLDYLKAVYG